MPRVIWPALAAVMQTVVVCSKRELELRGVTGGAGAAVLQKVHDVIAGASAKT